eukprot:gene27727-36545_t
MIFSYFVLNAMIKDGMDHSRYKKWIYEDPCLPCLRIVNTPSVEAEYVFKDEYVFDDIDSPAHLPAARICPNWPYFENYITSPTQTTFSMAPTYSTITSPCHCPSHLGNSSTQYDATGPEHMFQCHLIFVIRQLRELWRDAGMKATRSLTT